MRTYLYAGMCVYVVYVVCMHIHIEAGGQPTASFIKNHPPHLIGLELAEQMKLANQQGPGICLPPGFQNWDMVVYATPDILTWVLKIEVKS